MVSNEATKKYIKENKIMPCYRKTIKSGNIIEVYEYRSIRRIGQSYIPRTSSVAKTKEEKEVINIKNARAKLTRLINCNFDKNDIFLRLSYRKGLEDTEAVKELRKFIRRLNYHMKKSGGELKYITVTEKGKGRIHHHIICNCSDYNLIKSLWSNGGFFITNLYTDDYEDLAGYITKETIRAEGGRRWTQSRNLQKPIVTVKEIVRVSERELKAPKGYSVLENVLYVSDITGAVRYLRAVRHERSLKRETG